MRGKRFRNFCVSTFGFGVFCYDAEDTRALHYRTNYGKYLQGLRGTGACKYGGNGCEMFYTALHSTCRKRATDNLFRMAAMKKQIFKYTGNFLIMMFLLLFLCIPAFAAEEETQNTKTAEALAEEIYDGVQAETAEMLSDLGLFDFSMDSVLTLSPRKVIDALFGIFKGAYKQPLFAAVMLCVVAALGAFASAFFSQDSKTQTAFDFCAVLLITCILTKSLTSVLETGFSAVKLCSDFMLTYVPGFAGVIAMSGKPLTSAAYSAMMVGVSNLYAQVGIRIFKPLLLAYLCLCIFSALQEKYTLQPLVRCVKKGIYILFGLAATVFTGLLTVKGVLASGGDSVTVKGAKMLIGSTVPIVGGALSEGVSSVLASAALIKSTVGVFGIIVIACIILPAAIQLLLWCFALSVGGAVADTLGQSKMKNVMESVSGVLSVTNAFLLFTAFIFMVSTGIVLQFRGT